MQKVSPSWKPKNDHVIFSLLRNQTSDSYPVIQVKKIRIFSGFSLGIWDDFSNILANEGSLWDIRQRPHTPAHAKGSEHLKSNRYPMLNDTVVTTRNIATAKIVAFKYHRWFTIVKSILQSSFQVIPRLHAQVRTIASVLCCAIVNTFTMLEDRGRWILHEVS